jgi:hypothetical protein
VCWLPRGWAVRWTEHEARFRVVGRSVAVCSEKKKRRNEKWRQTEKKTFSFDNFFGSKFAFCFMSLFLFEFVLFNISRGKRRERERRELKYDKMRYDAHDTTWHSTARDIAMQINEYVYLTFS